MLPQSQTDSNLFARLERIMDKGFDEIRSALSGLDGRLRNLENNDAGYRAGFEIRMAACEKRQNEQDDCIKELEDHVDTLLPWMRGLRWAVGILGAAAIALFWSLVTGQVTLVFK